MNIYKAIAALGIAVIVVLWWNTRAVNRDDLPEIRHEHIDILSLPQTNPKPTYVPPNQNSLPSQGIENSPPHSGGVRPPEEQDYLPKAVKTMKFNSDVNADSGYAPPEAERFYPDEIENGNLTSDNQEPNNLPPKADPAARRSARDREPPLPYPRPYENDAGTEYDEP